MTDTATVYDFAAAQNSSARDCGQCAKVERLRVELEAHSMPQQIQAAQRAKHKYDYRSLVQKFCLAATIVALVLSLFI